MTPRILAAVLVAVLAVASPAFADVQLPGIISDHMLLQRGVPARIFGKAEPGEAISVTFRGQTARTVTDTLGRWELWLKPLDVGPAADMTIRGANTIAIADVLVGDVWIGSGQSNMQWAVRQAANAEHGSGRCDVPADPLLLRAAQDVDRSRRGRGCKVGGLHARDGQGVFSGSVFFRPAAAPGSQGPDGIDSLVMGRDTDRLVDQRSLTGRQCSAGATAHVLGKRHPAVSQSTRAATSSR